MLVGRCSSELSSHKLQAKSKKSQALSGAEGTPGMLILPMPFGVSQPPKPTPVGPAPWGKKAGASKETTVGKAGPP